jgi:hypothetical protein
MTNCGNFYFALNPAINFKVFPNVRITAILKNGSIFNVLFIKDVTESEDNSRKSISTLSPPSKE